MPGSSSSYLKYLAEVPLFSACSNKELQKIAKALKVPAAALLDESGRK